MSSRPDHSPAGYVEQLAETGTGGASEDPTRTTTRRERFEGKFNKRWREFKGELNDLLRGNSYYRPQNDVSDSQQIADFRDWVEDAIERIVVEPVRQRDAQEGAHWTAQRVREFYTHGIDVADRELRRVGYDVDADIDGTDVLRDDPSDLHQEQLAEEYLTVAQELEDVGRRTEQEITREYREAIGAGLAVGVTLDRLKERVDHSRAGKNATRLLAHSYGVEITNDAAIERYYEAGVEQTGTVVEIDVHEEDGTEADFITAGDLRVCPTCRTYAAGGPYRLKAIRNGNAPKPVRDTHPACRCLIVPIPNTATQPAS
ncbi:hypothetical protein [Saliphagus sp. LR7]|uniref:hypothetical protein n=1 Tax=Saliphagus sp. LR7 TaxID=2282654 RepID=UPI000DF76325|nr:hypothetical protein [Saliphagus sp. LR7]